MTHALNLFGEIEQDDNYQDDIELSQCFHSLMSNVKEAQAMLESKGIENVALPSTHLGPDPRDIQKTMTRTTPLPKHPVIFTKGGMSSALEEVADVAEAADENKPLVPVFTSSLRGMGWVKGIEGLRNHVHAILATAKTSVVTTYQKSIVSSKEQRDKGVKIFPGFPCCQKKLHL